MPLDYTTEALLERVRRTLQLRGVAGGGNQKLSAAQQLQICDEEIQQNLFPRLLTVREDYQEWRTGLFFVDGIPTYRVPVEAASSTFDHIEIRQTNGTTVIGQWRIPRIPVPQGAHYAASQGTSANCPTRYSVLGDQITFYPTPTATSEADYIAIVYHEFRPPRLCTTAETMAISAYSDTDPSVTLTVTIGADCTINDNSVVDVIPSQPPFMPLATGGVAQLTLPSTLVVDLSLSPLTSSAQVISLLDNAPYSIVTPTGYANIFPLPDAWFGAAVLACSASVALNLGDGNAYGLLRPEAEAAIERLVTFASNRIRKEPQIIMDRTSPLRRSGIGFPIGWNGGGS